MRAVSAGSTKGAIAFRVAEGVERGTAITIYLDGRPLPAFSGETLAAALLANGVQAFRIDKQGRPRAPWCNMGVCFECVVKCRRGNDSSPTGWHSVRACLTPVEPGMEAVPLASNTVSPNDG
jgi:hypothetical protein